MSRPITKWVSGKLCSTSYSTIHSISHHRFHATMSSLLKAVATQAWTRLKLMGSSWKDALAAAVGVSVLE